MAASGRSLVFRFSLGGSNHAHHVDILPDRRRGQQTPVPSPPSGARRGQLKMWGWLGASQSCDHYVFLSIEMNSVAPNAIYSGWNVVNCAASGNNGKRLLLFIPIGMKLKCIIFQWKLRIAHQDWRKSTCRPEQAARWIHHFGKTRSPRGSGMWRVRLVRVCRRNAGTAWLEGRRFRFGEPSDIVAQLSKLMAEGEKQPRYFPAKSTGPVPVFALPRRSNPSLSAPSRLCRRAPDRLFP